LVGFWVDGGCGFVMWDLEEVVVAFDVLDVLDGVFDVFVNA
jgi:hypothetical protein